MSVRVVLSDWNEASAAEVSPLTYVIMIVLWGWSVGMGILFQIKKDLFDLHSPTATALRINLKIGDTHIASRAHTHPSHSQTQILVSHHTDTPYYIFPLTPARHHSDRFAPEIEGEYNSFFF